MVLIEKMKLLEQKRSHFDAFREIGQNDSQFVSRRTEPKQRHHLLDRSLLLFIEAWSPEKSSQCNVDCYWNYLLVFSKLNVQNDSDRKQIFEAEALL